MNEYELDGSQLVPRERASERAETVDQEWQVQRRKPADRTGASGIEQMLSASRARLRRLSPGEAYEAVARTEAILVDIRPEGQRAIEGSIASVLVVERNVLEWRFDPASSDRSQPTEHHRPRCASANNSFASGVTGAGDRRHRQREVSTNVRKCSRARWPWSRNRKRLQSSTCLSCSFQNRPARAIPRPLARTGDEGEKARRKQTPGPTANQENAQLSLFE